jgi:CDP-diacylglycerol--glycerol-3-phosphate 3-phosphatidyltransferase
LARLLNQSTSLGRLLDPIADKAMVIIALCFINYHLDNQLYQVLNGIPTIVILFREVFVSGIREFLGQKSQILHVTTLSKWKTASQMIAIGLLLCGNVNTLSFFPFSVLGLIMLWVAAFITILTGMEYFKRALPEIERG